MKRTLAICITVTGVGIGVAPAQAATMPAAGIWQTRSVSGADGSYDLSFVVRRERRRIVVADIVPGLNGCGDTTNRDEYKAKRFRIDRRGRFRGRLLPQGTQVLPPAPSYIRGRFSGKRRARVVASVTYSDGCRNTYPLARVPRPVLREGIWRGVDATGGRLELFMAAGGILIQDFGRQLGPRLCSNGQFDPDVQGFGLDLMPDSLGHVEGSNAESRLRPTTFVRGHVSPTAFTGTYRTIGPRENTPDGPLCDTGAVTFKVTPPPR